MRTDLRIRLYRKSTIESIWLAKLLEHKKVPIFLRASFISIFLTLFITVSIATAMQFTGWKFFDSEGKQVFEMTTMSEEEAEPHWQYDWINAKVPCCYEK